MQREFFLIKLLKGAIQAYTILWLNTNGFLVMHPDVQTTAIISVQCLKITFSVIYIYKFFFQLLR